MNKPNYQSSKIFIEKKLSIKISDSMIFKNENLHQIGLLGLARL